VTARLPFTQAAVRRTIGAALKSGLRVVGIRSDGTVIVDDGGNHHPLLPKGGTEMHVSDPSKWEDVEA
jgi:hypothetical protein